MTPNHQESASPDEETPDSPGLLFLCVANSARSQIAEGLARTMAPAGTRIASAGSCPRNVHPLAIQVLQEVGIDITSHRAKALRDVPLEHFGTAITLCAEQTCPAPPRMKRLHWPTEDPAAAVGSEQHRLDAFRRVRDEIRDRLRSLLTAEAGEERRP